MSFFYSYQSRDPPKLVLQQIDPTYTSSTTPDHIQQFFEELKKPRKQKIPWYVQQQMKVEEEKKNEEKKKKILRAKLKAKKKAEQKKKSIELEKTHPQEEDGSEEGAEETKEPVDKKKLLDDIRNSMKSTIAPVIEREHENEYKFQVKNAKEEKEQFPEAKNEEIYKSQKELPKYLKNHCFSSTFHEKSMYKFQGSDWTVSQYQIETLSLNELKIMTFNVWFDRFYFRDRVKQIISILKSESAHVICLQEVTPQFVKILVEDDWVKKNCFISDSDGSSIYMYGLMTITTIPVQTLSIQTFPTLQGRNSQIATLKINNNTIKIANVHLESLNSRDLRETQLFLVEFHLQCDHSIILGDFNFDSKRNYILEETPLENDILQKYGLESYWDSWKELYPNDDGYTFDSENNSNIEHVELMRYDRIMVKKSNDWRLKEMKLVGNSYISDELPIYPSDHFGLLLTVSFVN